MYDREKGMYKYVCTGPKKVLQLILGDVKTELLLTPPQVPIRRLQQHNIFFSPRSHYCCTNQLVAAENALFSLHKHTHTSALFAMKVGQPKFSIETHAPSGLPPGFSVTRFSDLSSCRDYVHSRGGTLVGVEIGDSAKNIDEEPFSGTCAFMPGNEVRQMYVKLLLKPRVLIYEV